MARKPKNANMEIRQTVRVFDEQTFVDGVYEKGRQARNTSVLESESGLFFINENDIVLRFEPTKDNQFFDEETEHNDNYTFKTDKSIRTLIIPKGVKGFVSDFMRDIRVIERFELLDGLISIGNNSFDIGKEQHCVFANCILPTVIIPQSVEEIGIFAFGHTHIESLQLPTTLRSPYGRQFKDSYIELLRLPKEWKDYINLEKDGCLRVKKNLNSNDFGYLRWPSTYVKRMEFY